MIIVLGFILQLIISAYLVLFGWAAATNLGFSDTSWLEKLVGLTLVSLGLYGLYDLSTMFNYIG
jgi:hypothetical protein